MPALHLYFVAQGDYSAAGLEGETWQTGCRLLATTATERQEVDNLPTNLYPSAQNITDSGTDWTASSNWFLEMGVTDFDPVSWLVDHALPAFTSYLGQTVFSEHTQLRSLLMYPIGDNGLVVPAAPYAQGSPARLDFTGNYPDGGGGLFSLPLQNSIVVSHRTPQTGRRGRGRMFLPGISGSGVLDANGTIGATRRGTISAAHVTLLEALKRGSGAPFIIPAVIGAPWDRYAMITQCQVGSVMDTQRRRRRSLVEAITSATVDPA